MRIVDAGVVVELLAGDLDPDTLGEEELAAPHLIDSEVTHVLRGLVRRGVLSEEQGVLALEGFTQLTLTRFPADWLRARIWALRHNLSGYDATYVALTEMTGATALLTTDAGLARTHGPECYIELLR
ncbi:type II toxin-antitoxin system VapC family toxin [Ornithinimicrobium cryptoxanthini]|uniref:type II toxin-antitoxin system VapC family toxin n=1 Tax=Ornithinimicrobium cryptoxanthini TaxID=2934161 RepID=UPI0021195CCD|nr:type II toxin-antitoxin system VapC family toxin [Ornithinimicrobium cryptoxanthini]